MQGAILNCAENTPLLTPYRGMWNITEVWGCLLGTRQPQGAQACEDKTRPPDNALEARPWINQPAPEQSSKKRIQRSGSAAQGLCQNAEAKELLLFLFFN